MGVAPGNPAETREAWTPYLTVRRKVHGPRAPRKDADIHGRGWPFKKDPG